jgi:hypothetical protein
MKGCRKKSFNFFQCKEKLGRFVLRKVELIREKTRRGRRGGRKIAKKTCQASFDTKRRSMDFFFANTMANDEEFGLTFLRRFCISK